MRPESRRADPPYAAAQLCDPSVRPRHRYQDYSGLAWTREIGNDSAIYPCRNRPDHGGREPARPAIAAARDQEEQEGAAAGVTAGSCVAPVLEVADIFRDHGAAWRRANRGHVSLEQLKVMCAIERCRTAALGGHVARCENEACGHTAIAYNSCRNRHCPKCQGAAAREWLAERQAELLPVPYFHVVYTLPARIADIAYQNKAAIYGILFKASAETTLRIAADPKHLGARIGFISVLHTWGSAMTHHPHVHMIVPGGGLSADGQRWIACRPDYFLPVPVLSQLFRRLFLRCWSRLTMPAASSFSGSMPARR